MGTWRRNYQAVTSMKRRMGYVILVPRALLVYYFYIFAENHSCYKIIENMCSKVNLLWDLRPQYNGMWAPCPGVERKPCLRMMSHLALLCYRVMNFSLTLETCMNCLNAGISWGLIIQLNMDIDIHVKSSWRNILWDLEDLQPAVWRWRGWPLWTPFLSTWNFCHDDFTLGLFGVVDSDPLFGTDGILVEVRESCDDVKVYMWPVSCVWCCGVAVTVWEEG